MAPRRDGTVTDTYLSEGKLVDPTPMPADIPPVKELGVTSAPLKSASFFLGSFCQKYNDDFMLCKAENNDPAHCLKEGRRVTRCAQDFITKLRENCEKEWEAHWECLERQNHEFYRCRKPETTFNECVFRKFGIEKKIPGTPEGNEQIHEKKRPVWKTKQS